ncbi:helix-turn-helix domain-containing protein [Solirubrobacter taibaiensis]|nr:helix-turn-helix domain-containing protein [Solirubrobacter taibaiensis]
MSTQDEDLQSLVDGLGAALRRAVLIDDLEFRTLAYSPQWGAIDGARRETILMRAPTKAVRDFTMARIASAEEIIRMAGDDRLGIDPRLCVPIRRGRQTLAYIWLMAADGELVGRDLELVRGAAEAAAAILTARERLAPLDHADLVAGLSAADQSERERARRAVTDRGLLRGRTYVTCVLASADHDAALVAADVCRRLLRGRGLTCATADGGLLSLSPTAAAPMTLEPREIAGWLSAAAGDGVVIGQSDAFTELEDFATSIRQARAALRVARSGAARFAGWTDLGADQLLAQLPAGLLRDAPAALLQLLDDDPVLAQTLETFLEAAGDIKETSARLHLHRSSVYNRLEKLTEVTGLDLQRGDDRLLAHLVIRLLRLR